MSFGFSYTAIVTLYVYIKGGSNFTVTQQTKNELGT